MTKKTYWNSNGKYQAEYDKIHPQLIQDSGEASTKHGELLRCVTNCYYDLYNNGGGNWDGNREEQFEHVIENKNLLVECASQEGLSASEFSELLDSIELTMDNAWKLEDWSMGCVYRCDDYLVYGYCDCEDDSYSGLTSFKFDEVAGHYEKLTDIIIAYAFNEYKKNNKQ